MPYFLYLLFFLSGLGGLVYQVVWIREFGQIFGNTIQSASIVAGTFVFGLGLGCYLAGRMIDRKAQKNYFLGLKYYAYSEIIIAALGLLLTFAIPYLNLISPFITQYSVGPNGWNEISNLSYLYRYITAVLLIAPITIIMGGTLTFLIRFVLSRSLDMAGWKIGILYGVNTLGAAIGCGMVDLWIIPSFGLMTAKNVPVLCNLAAGIGALWLHHSMQPVNGRVEPIPSEGRRSVKTEHGILWPAGLSIAISGFCAMGMEIVWFRYLSSVYMSRRSIFSLVLVIILLGIWLGSVLGGYLSKKYKNPAQLYIRSQIAFGLTVLLGFYLFFNTSKLYFYGSVENITAATPNNSILLLFEYFNTVVPALKTLLLPAISMGFAFPLINDLLQVDEKQVGTRAGLIYLWNSFGAIAGSLLTGFILLPQLGMQNSILFLVLGSVLAALPIAIFYQKQFFLNFRWFTSALLVLFLCAISYWLFLPKEYVVKSDMLYNLFEQYEEKLIHISEGMNETVMIGEQLRDSESRRLYTNGYSMSGTSYGARRYMRAFAHLPLLQIENPKSALVICFGVGNTAHAVSIHPSIERIDIADLSKNVLNQAHFFENWNQGVLKDSRVKVYINDGRQHLSMQASETYDLVTLEPPPLTQAGVASLYSKEFYGLVRDKLKRGGYVTQWLPIYQVPADHARRLVKAFIDVFPNAVLLNGADREFILLAQNGGNNQIDWVSVRSRIIERAAVREDLEKIDLSKPVEWLGTFVASSEWLSEKLQNTTPMTDNEPIIEYGNWPLITQLPKELFMTNGLSGWCPSCFDEFKQLDKELSMLSAYFAVQQAIYWNEKYTSVDLLNREMEPYKIPVAITSPQRSISSAHLLRPLKSQELSAMMKEYPYIQKNFGPRFLEIPVTVQ